MICPYKPNETADKDIIQQHIDGYSEAATIKKERLY
jgi:hypothetical protein